MRFFRPAIRPYVGRHADQTRDRLVFVAVCCLTVYAVIVGRLVWLGTQEYEGRTLRAKGDPAITASRPDLLDRNGELLAMDIKMSSLFAVPREVQDHRATYEALASVFPDLDQAAVMRAFRSNGSFRWIKREVTPEQQAAVMELGLPGIRFERESRRFYPAGRVAAHVLGHVNVDNRGAAGMEKRLDLDGLADLHKYGFAVSQKLDPVRLSLDLRVQHVVRDVLADAITRYRAIAAGGVVLNAHTGEVVSMVSLPDYDPNEPRDALVPENLNRITKGVFEMGSTFKAFSTAMALDSGRVRLSSRFDARKAVRFGRHRIGDFHGKNRVLSVPEIFIYSSNIGTIRMTQTVGPKVQRDFLKDLGLLDPLEFELPEIARPQEPRDRPWKAVSAATISYGHGLSTTPLQTAVAGAALINGGLLIPPTLVPRDRSQADRLAKRVIRPETSDKMRYLYRLNVLAGSGKRAEVPGFLVGGKTGTANKKKKNGRGYDRTRRFNAFLSAFPMHDPQYVVLVFIDEPKSEKKGRGATSGLNAAPAVGEIVRRAAPLLGVSPDMRVRETGVLADYRGGPSRSHLFAGRNSSRGDNAWPSR